MTGLHKSEEDRLRLALSVIGEEAGRGDTAAESEVRPRSVRRMVLAGALLSLVLLLAGGLAVALKGYQPGGDQASTGYTVAEYVSCARLVAEGDVVGVRPAAEAGRVVLDFEVDDWIKPASGPNRVKLDVVDPREERVRELWRPGDHVLIVVPVQRDRQADSFEGDLIGRYREQMEQALLKARTDDCPIP